MAVLQLNIVRLVEKKYIPYDYRVEIWEGAEGDSKADQTTVFHKVMVIREYFVYYCDKREILDVFTSFEEMTNGLCKRYGIIPIISTNQSEK